MSVVSLEDFSVRYGGAVPVADEGRVEALIGDAEALVEDYLRRPLSELASVPTTVVAVICASARRAYDNPAGFIMESVGNYTYQRADRGGSGVYLTADERRLLRRALGLMGVATVILEGLGVSTRPTYAVEEEPF